MVSHSDVKAALSRAKISKLPLDIGKLGASAMLKALRTTKLPQYKVGSFFRTASQSIALAGIQRCFKIFASGARCYFGFCELRGAPSFPVRGRVVFERISIVKPSPTFSHYFGCVRIDCHFPEQTPILGRRGCEEHCGRAQA